jgi:N-acetylglucosamine-6-phosphate deacetylase
VLLTAGAVLTGSELLQPGWIEVSGPTVTAVGAGSPPRSPDHDFSAMTVVPGFVDTHVHGGGGGSFSGGADQTATAVAFHRRHGTTTLLASLVSEAPDDLLRQIRELAEMVRGGLVAGIHLEGPWLAAQRCGAHDPALLRDPESGELNHVLDAGAGTIRMVTLAPERAGGLEAIRRIVDAGAVAAVGHTEASYLQTCAAIEAGATVGTHLFNAMRPIHHREPGPVIALLEDPRVTVELIADGVHIDAALYRHVTHAAGIDRVSLVTDAMAAAGMADGAYRIGPLAVDVSAGVARLAGTETIAGSTATMDALFRFSVQHSRLARGEALVQAVRQSSVNPARALGLPNPELQTGAGADLVVLDVGLNVHAVLCAGQWIGESVSGA